MAKHRPTIRVLALAVVAGGCATSSNNSPELTSVLERLEAATVRTEVAAEQAAAAAQHAEDTKAQGEPVTGLEPYHTALIERAHRNPTPQSVRTEREATQVATEFLRGQGIDWGTLSRVRRTAERWYLVEFVYRPTDGWDLDGALLVDPHTGDVFLALRR